MNELFSVHLELKLNSPPDDVFYLEQTEAAIRVAFAKGYAGRNGEFILAIADQLRTETDRLRRAYPNIFK